MPVFPIARTQRTVPAEGPSTFARLDTNTGAGEVWRGVQQAGDAIFQFGEKLYQAKEAVETSKGKLAMDTLAQTYMSTALTTGDPKARADLLTKAEKDMRSVAVNARLKLYADSAIGNLRGEAMNLNARMQVQNLKDEFSSVGQRIMNDRLNYENELRYKEHIAGGVASGIKSRAEGESLIRSYPVDHGFAVATQLANDYPGKAMDELNKVAALNRLTAEQAQTYSQIEGFIKAKQVQSSITDKSAIAAQTRSLYEKAYIEGEPVSWEMVRSTRLDADPEKNVAKQIAWFEDYKQSMSQRLKYGQSAIEEGDMVVLSLVRAKIDLAPHAITPEMIYGAKGLGEKYKPGLVDRLDARMKDANSEDNKWRKQLGRLYEAGLFGKKDKPKTSQVYLEVSERLDNFLKTNPTSEQAGEFFSKQLILPNVTKVYLGKDEMPGFEDDPLKVSLPSSDGTTKMYWVRPGDVIVHDGVRKVAVSREGGNVLWRDESTYNQEQEAFDKAAAKMLSNVGIQPTTKASTKSAKK